MVDGWRRVVFTSLAVIFLFFGCTSGQQSLVSRQERFDLIKLRSSLGLRGKEWPIKSDPCTQWAGIQCANGRVTGINISGFRRTRRGSQNPQFLVDSLQNLTLLSSFNASSFALPGPIPEWLGLRLASLQVLDLRSCLIRGSIPPTLGNLSNLVELYLSDNKLTGIVPPSIGQLSKLSVLDVSKNALTGSIPDTFSGLRNLALLDVSSNFLTGAIPSGLGTLSRLQFLNLSGNSLSASIPSQLGDLSRLTDLDLGSNSLTGLLPINMRGLRNLQRMMIGRNFLSGSLPSNLFLPLIRLQLAVLSHNNFSGDFPSVLWSIPSLQYLDVSVNSLTGVLLNVNAISNASSVTVFNISKNFFYGNLTRVIGKFSFIDMSDNYFEGPVPFYAQNNTSLTRNCLWNVTDQRNLTDCASFYASKNLVLDDLGEPTVTKSPPPLNKRSNRAFILFAAIFGGVGLILLVIAILVLLIICKHRRDITNQRIMEVPALAGGSSPPPVASLNFASLGDSFSYEQILQATDEFSNANFLKHGQSGDLFRGKLEGEILVVIKKVDLHSSVKKDSHLLELDLFSKVSHPRFVPLLGHCLENENEKFLVYKHMPNADLSSSLIRKKGSDNNSLQSLDWITRLKIAIGAAEGISYLHHECTPPLVHRDVQATSILLDDKFEVRLGSLSGVLAQEIDTHQNRISKLLRLPQTSEQPTSGTPNATCAYDVYCFGKVLLELVTGKLDISSSATDATMKEWLEATLPYISIYDKELVRNIIDPSLIIDEDHLEEVWAMAIVARSCLNPKPTRRPLIRYILKALENPLKVVREEYTSSARLRTSSSRGSWNAALFGSWRHSSSDVAAMPTAPSHQVEEASSLIHLGTADSRESGQTGDGNSKEIIPNI